MGKDKDDDDRDYMQKASAGDLKKFDKKDWIDAVADGSSLVPGAVGDVAAAPLKAISGSMGAERDYKKYSKKLGRDLASEATGNNRALKRQVAEMDGRAEANFERFGTMGAGAIAGQAVGTALIPIPLLGTAAGAWLGSSVTGDLYDQAVQTQDQDAVGLVSQIRDMQQRRQPVKAEFVFAALAANLPDSAEKRLEDRLESLAGTRNFAEAVQQGKTAALTRLMQEFDTDIRVDTALPVDPTDPRKTVAQQYTDLINSGQMDARALIFRNDMPQIQQLMTAQQQLHAQQQQAQQPVQPVPQQQPPVSQDRMAVVNPELAGIAADMNKMGITPALDENGNLVLLPNNNKQPPGKA